jgi:hypothetical protein
MVRAVLVPYVVARILVGTALAMTRHMVDDLGVVPVPIQTHQGLLAWDGAFYADIARGGYDAVPQEGLRFFPLVPLLARAVALVPGVDTNLALILVGNLSALALGFVLYRLAWDERGDDDFARRAVWFAYLAPPAFTLVLGYAEATLMLLVAIALLGDRRQRWWLAAIAGFLAGLARPVGVLLAVPAFIEAIQHRRALTGRDIAGRVAAVVAPFLGLLTYLSWAADRTDSFLYPLRVQQDAERRGSWQFPVTNIVDTARDFVRGDELSAGVHVVSAGVALVLLAVMIRRLPASFSCYGAAALLLGLTASNLDSFERYMLATVPFVLAAADLVDREPWERPVLVVLGGGLFAASILAFTGVLVP